MSYISAIVQYFKLFELKQFKINYNESINKISRIWLFILLF
jgi:hypothetical protein